MAPQEHNKLVGIFLMAHGGLQAVVMLVLCLIYAGFGALILGSARGDEKVVGVFMIVAMLFIAIFAALFAGSQILGGYKMFKEKTNARAFGIVGSIISCLSFPLGTAVGVYGLWFLFGEEGKRFYLGGSQPQPMFENTPPPPNSWQ